MFPKFFCLDMMLQAVVGGQCSPLLGVKASGPKSRFYGHHFSVVKEKTVVTTHEMTRICFARLNKLWLIAGQCISASM